MHQRQSLRPTPLIRLQTPTPSPTLLSSPPSPPAALRLMQTAMCTRRLLLPQAPASHTRATPFNVNTTQNITTLSNLSSGLVGSNSGLCTIRLLRPLTASGVLSPLPIRSRSWGNTFGAHPPPAAPTARCSPGSPVLRLGTASSSVAAGTGISISAKRSCYYGH